MFRSRQCGKPINANMEKFSARLARIPASRYRDLDDNRAGSFVIAVTNLTFLREAKVHGSRYQGPVSRKSPKATRKTSTRLFCKAGLSICCKGNEN